MRNVDKTSTVLKQT
ncbi:23S rRNA methyltransferase attenuation leader peptide, partial [Streptococcus suis]